jgi:uncharacterized membrane protein
MISSQKPYLLKVFHHELPLWRLGLTFLLVHVFLYLYIAVFSGSLLTPICLVLLAYLAFTLIRPPTLDCKDEWLSEDSLKALYKALYMLLNRSSGYFRSAIELRGGFKAVAKAVAFLYLSIAFKFLGDRLAIYLCKIFVQ